MEQFTILQVIVSSEGEETYHKYLNFRKFPEIELVNDLSCGALFPRIDDARNHAKAFIEQLSTDGILAVSFLKDRQAVAVSTRIIHYSGEFATNLQPTWEPFGSIVTISKQPAVTIE